MTTGIQAFAYINTTKCRIIKKIHVFTIADAVLNTDFAKEKKAGDNLPEITPTGHKTLLVEPDKVDYVITPNGTYQWMEGDLVKIPEPTNNGNP